MDDRLTAHSPARLLKEWDAGRAQAQLAGIAGAGVRVCC